ncbi:hypothetical protein HJA87_20160 [Rhizobium bangladeshense]|uniref:Uncharacterized protein n=1 Tax=Rhizobium bangladeshense TaxID=1138189 RepID=A0ABS7LL05_9HYPH|nr:hypothetical protein [Rhizobium bangladeshense]MBX4867557.1 hypothetical protein [Rhizobium bangladeshense]MBX4871849.1 hypothetical protein [Rhizobium bangladeshense]MBX4883163.1 hypothetical protein [Rhizobium bangladeshense]MBY3592169.1 hypothetical protein [Rhizobium bangladeshense]QSY96647.1 hypothetical protein J2J97_23205 [Rhizobium bangladeshense]
MKTESIKRPDDMAPAYDVGQGQTITAWAVSALIASYFPGEPAPAEDRVNYRFINGFVDVGDLPCRKAFWSSMVGRELIPDTSWPTESLYLPGSNRRVEFTSFWHVPTHVRKWLKGTFRTDAPRTLNLALKTCGGVRIWVNGQEAVRFEPFKRNVESATEIALPLGAGDNEILVHSEDLAERDTTWFFELEMLDKEPLRVLLPVALDQDEVRELEALSRGVRPARDVFVREPLEIIFDTAPERDLPVEIKIVGHGHERPVLVQSKLTLHAHQARLIVEDVSGIADGYHGIHMTIGSGPGSVIRVIDAAFMSSISPLPPEPSLAARKRQALEYSARFGANRVGRLIALMETGYDDQESFDRIIGATLASIDAREDCSDFIMVPLLWLLGAYGDRMPKATVDRIRHSVLSYRYWVDEPGNDAMWFWSENHVLCFHTSQLLAGLLLPDAMFSASGRTGRQQAELAAVRLGHWFDSVEAHGLAEWNSAAYYPIDFIGLLALERWADTAVAARARAQIDLIFRMIALHTLAGVPAGSQGRAYDKELRAGPLTELAPFAHVAFGTGWLNNGVAALTMFCAGSYEPPAELAELAALPRGRNVEARYSQGLESGKLVLYKNEAAQLSTVVDHKTGRKGHQQHVLDIRLAGHPMARLWVNHPGEDDPWGNQRPSYWAGNGTLPRVAQHRDVALLIEDTGDARHAWTHAYIGRDGLDDLIVEDKWLIARSGRGFAALWASNGLELITDGPTAGREARSYGSLCGWAAIVASGNDDAYKAFIERLCQTSVSFDPTLRLLSLTPPGGQAIDLSYADGLSIAGKPRPFTHDQPHPILTHDSAAFRAGADGPFYS